MSTPIALISEAGAARHERSKNASITAPVQEQCTSSRLGYGRSERPRYTQPVTTPHDNPWIQSRNRTGDEYDATYERRAAAGEDVHGEADFVARFEARTVLDAGCGTGRVGRELARRGVEVVGVDLDEVMLNTARAKAPNVEWVLGDLASLELGRRFEAIVMAGNVMIFLTPGTEAAVAQHLSRHLAPGGRLIAGFQLRPGGLSIAQYDAIAIDAGLTLAERWATWDCDPWARGGDYAVSVHRPAG
jgi:SAM-dependent methyltransferase